MTTFLWIYFGGVLMSAIALAGSLTLVLTEVTLKKLLLPLVALAAGTLLGVLYSIRRWQLHPHRRCPLDSRDQAGRDRQAQRRALFVVAARLCASFSRSVRV